MSPAQLELSIARELARLLNTRSRLSLAAFETCTGTTLDYGVPDFAALSAQSPLDMDLLQQSVARAIGLYEPRLQQVVVKAFTAAAGKAARLLISGSVTIGMQLRPLNFELQLDALQGGLAKGK